MKCGCKIVVIQGHPSKDQAIKYCHLHTAAEELLSALKKALEAIKIHDEAPYQCESVEGAQGSCNCRKILEEAISKASPKEK